jgi:hypothetical protein
MGIAVPGFKVLMILQAAFDAFIAAGLCTKATLQVDDAPFSDILSSGVLFNPCALIVGQIGNCRGSGRHLGDWRKSRTRAASIG